MIQNFIKKLLTSKINCDKIKVVYNGVSDDYFVIHDENKRTSNLPFLTDTYVLFVGGRAGYKNFQLVVDAIFETSLNAEIKLFKRLSSPCFPNFLSIFSAGI